MLPASPEPEEPLPESEIDQAHATKIRVRIAFHEAGHAVVSRYFGIVVEELSIRPRAGVLGWVATAKTPATRRTNMYAQLRRVAEGRPDQSIGIVTDWRHPRNVFDDEASFHAELHVLVAGMVAEEIRFKSHLGGASDRRWFHLFVSCLYGSASGQLSGCSVALDKLLQDRYWNSCRKVLSEPEAWGWVTAVARAALEDEHGVLTGEEIDSLRPHPPSPLAALPKSA